MDVEDMTIEQVMEELVKFANDDGFAGELMRRFMEVDAGLAADIRATERKMKCKKS